MAQNKIPLRPKGRYDLTTEERDCLTWYLLKGCTQTQAYGLFVRTDLVYQKTLLKTEAQQFFASKDAVAYLKSYQRVIDGVDENSSSELSTKDMEQKKLEAIKSLINWATEQSINISGLDDDTASLVLKVADKVGLFNNLEKSEEKPRRYLPERCGDCRYRLFIEQQGKEGKLLDDCEYCKFRKYSNENGVRYTPQEQLDIPQYVLKEFDLEHYEIAEDVENQDAASE